MVYDNVNEINVAETQDGFMISGFDMIFEISPVMGNELKNRAVYNRNYWKETPKYSIFSDSQNLRIDPGSVDYSDKALDALLEMQTDKYFTLSNLALMEGGRRLMSIDANYYPGLKQLSPIQVKIDDEIGGLTGQNGDLQRVAYELCDMAVDMLRIPEVYNRFFY